MTRREDQTFMRASPWLVGWVLSACTPAPSPPAKSPTTTAVPVIRANPSELTPPAPTRRAGPNRCLPKGRVALPVVPEIHQSTTCVDQRRAEAKVERELKKKFQPTVKGSTVEVSFGCDPITFDVRQIHLEVGYGHGGHLGIWRLQREEDDAAEEERQEAFE